ncbi:hypothetical protein [Domibacillus indicus]|uniref:hypothetical protein n=1 Tax=Domibacillus indicus TaxID=1437523 RepID=UPI0018CD9F8D|nr:hypothetical protein [Domibacillus indicus]
MNIVQGQGLMMCLDFADGAECTYPRTFLVLDTDVQSNQISLLNISSVKKKEHKLLYSSNLNVVKFKPPFYLKSFVKLDSLYVIEYFPDLVNKVMDGGQTLDPLELTNIQFRYNSYLTDNEVNSVFYQIDKVRSLNAL